MLAACSACFKVIVVVATFILTFRRRKKSLVSARNRTLDSSVCSVVALSVYKMKFAFVYAMKKYRERGASASIPSISAR